MNSSRLAASFFSRDVLIVAPELVGKILVRSFENGSVERFVITEVEAYRGEEDLACHASKGRTARTEVMYHRGGLVYVYLIYGMYWMLNFVTGEPNNPQAILIRGIAGYSGPGRLTKRLSVGKDFYGEDLIISSRMWVEENNEEYNIMTGSRIGIDYAGNEWVSKPWRYYINDKIKIK
ncbi:MAG TPA: 3-methyladenine DNA glycosylase [Bacteroidales bacterium]|nr:3-methyladenine DNA glycosylase [Bacteroidales bacterium]